jgi:DNA polymerase-1
MEYPAFGLSNRSDMSRGEAKVDWHLLRNSPKIKDSTWASKLDFARDNGYVKTV